MLVVLTEHVEPREFPLTGHSTLVGRRPDCDVHVRWDSEVTNQDDEVVAAYDVLTMVATDEHWASVQ